MNKDTWWNMFINTGNPDAYMIYRSNPQEEKNEPNQDYGDSDQADKCGGLQ